jgi:hypothetical protein
MGREGKGKEGDRERERGGEAIAYIHAKSGSSTLTL